ncbi:beta-ketoacyl synthase [Streptomyces sp. DSM 116496]|uniref:beta-ketoacyl-[acyl-carrier-protein] synthase family protein n=1 Tax=Streptomyces stoeckheimensis TaxID=3344656 RepID=UPI0038B27509
MADTPDAPRPRRRVLVTGIGMITPLGGDTASFWLRFLTGRSAIRELDDRFADLPVRIGAPAAIEPADCLPRAQARTMNRGSQFAVLAACEAWADAGLDTPVVDPHPAGLSVGTIIDGAPALVDASHQLRDKDPRHVSPHASPMTVPNGAVARIAIDLDTRGEARTIVSACASGTEATDRIRAGHIDVAVGGGTEAVIHPTVMAAFASLRALARGTRSPAHASKPFDEHRDGFVLGEGAAFLILEAEEHARARGARTYCEIAGWGLSADAQGIDAAQAPTDGAAGNSSQSLRLSLRLASPTQPFLRLYETPRRRGGSGFDARSSSLAGRA